MKMLKILLGMFVMLIVAQAVSAVGDKLNITDIDVEVDGKNSKNLEDGDDISKEAEPESEIEFKIEITNSYNGSGTGDLDIEDITVEVTIQEIDDDDDLEEESREFDIRADDDKRVTINFKLPLEVDEGTFDVEILVEGEDENGLEHEATATITLEVEKENDEVRFQKRTLLSPSELSCQRTTQLTVGVLNTGSNDQDDSVLEIANSELEINFRETFDLSDDPFDSDSKFSKTYSVRLPDTVEPGIYPIVSQVIYDDGDETETKTLELLVSACEKLAPVEEEPEEEEEPEVVVITPQPTVPTTPVVTVTEPTTPVVTVTEPTGAVVSEETSLLSSTGFVSALIVGEVLVVIIAIVLIVTLMRRRA